MYALIGKAVVRFGLIWVRRRYSTHLKVLGVGAVAAIIAGAFLASRDVPEG